jgi:DNA-binding response OmpR family regulator
LVEDSEDMRQVLVDAFHEDYHIIEAGNGDIGFQLAHKLNPDLVVSDVMMPGMNGNELCEKLKTTPETSHIPVVLLTARSSAEHRLEGIRSGADDYIAKPLDADQEPVGVAAGTTEEVREAVGRRGHRDYGHADRRTDLHQGDQAG